MTRFNLGDIENTGAPVMSNTPPIPLITPALAACETFVAGFLKVGLTPLFVDLKAMMLLCARH